MYNEILKDEARNDVRALRRAAKISGEAYMFGIDRGEAGPFLAQRGFRDVKDTTLEELKAKYFTGKNAGRAVPSGIAIASARSP